MKDFNKKIDSIIDCLSEPDGGNAVTESDIREAIIELNELRKLKLLDVSDVVTQSEQLVCDDCNSEIRYTDYGKQCSKCFKYL